MSDSRPTRCAVLAAGEAVGDVALRQDRALEALRVALERQHAPAAPRASGWSRTTSSMAATSFVERFDDGVEVVDDDVEEGVREEVSAALEDEGVGLGAAAHLFDGVRRRAMERDDVVRADVQVELGRVRARGSRVVADVVDDDEQVVAVVVDLGRVDERVVAVVDRQRVEAEDIAQQRFALVAAVRVDVDPERGASGSREGRARPRRCVRPLRRAPSVVGRHDVIIGRAAYRMRRRDPGGGLTRRATMHGRARGPCYDAPAGSSACTGRRRRRGGRRCIRTVVASSPGNAHPALAQSICDSLEMPLGQCEVFEFSNENIFVRILENVREQDVFIVQPLSSPVNTQRHGAADHDRRVQARVGGAHHGRHAVLRLRSQRQEGPAARADHGAAAREPDRDGGRRPRADDRPARRPDPGLLQHPGRRADRALHRSAATSRSATSRT